jgi:GAF domain-containing protein
VVAAGNLTEEYGGDAGRTRGLGVARHQQLVRTLVELADTLIDDYDVVDLLYLLTERCVDVLEAAAAGVLVQDRERDLDVVAASSHEMRVLELFEVQAREGPCWEAFVTGEPVSETDVAGQAQRWPAFAPRAAALGYGSVHAEPLRLRGDRIGALNVFREERRAFNDEERLAAAGLADMAAIGILHARALADADEQLRQLRRTVDSRAVVEQAKAVLAERLGTDAATAFDWLRRYARNRNQRLGHVAQEVLDGQVSAAAVVAEQTG